MCLITQMYRMIFTIYNVFKKNYINRVNGLYEEKGCSTRMYNRKTLLAYIDVNIKCELKPGENCNTYKCIDGKEKHFIMKFIFVLSIVLDNNGVNSYTCSHCTVNSMMSIWDVLKEM